ncbi:MAG: FHA domain-containing protein, partial [Deltaproteobacteria bacterium]|nr:FHA domain-containing protein [Deltaproteobacteria bacterium]
MANIPTIRIAVTEGDSLAREEVFNQKTIRIGKAGQAHLRLSDNNVSRQHAVIEVLDSGDVRLTDLESTNGTLLNGEKITQAIMRSGDEVAIGETKLVVSFEGGARSASEDFYVAPAIQDVGEVTDHTALEIALLWNEELVTVHHYQEGAKVTAGDRPEAQVFLPSEYLGGDGDSGAIFDFAVADGKGFLVDVSTKGVEGDCLVDGKIVKLAELEKRGKLAGGKLKIDTSTKARLKYGPFTLMVSLSYLPATQKSTTGKRFNFHDQIYSLMSLILHLLFLSLVTLIPEEQLKATKDPYMRRSAAFKMVQVAEFEKLAKAEQERKEAEEAARRRKKEAAEKKIDTSAPATMVATGPASVGVGRGPAVGSDGLTSKLTPTEATVRSKKMASAALTTVLGQYDDLLGGMGGGGGGGGGGGFGGGGGGGGGGTPGMGGGG